MVLKVICICGWMSYIRFMNVEICEKMCPFLKGRSLRPYGVLPLGEWKKHGTFLIGYVPFRKVLDAAVCTDSWCSFTCLEKKDVPEDFGMTILEEKYRHGNDAQLVERFFDFERDGRRCPIYVERLMAELAAECKEESVCND